MGSKLGTIARGPVLLFLIIVALAGITAATGRSTGTTAAPPTATSAPPTVAPTASPTAPPSPTPHSARPTAAPQHTTIATGTPVPPPPTIAASATPRPPARATAPPAPPSGRTVVLGPHPPYLDAATNVQATVLRLSLQRAPGADKLLVAVTMAIQNAGSRAAAYDRRNFYAVARTGQTYGALAARSTLTAGHVAGGKTVRGTLTFQVPAQAGAFTFIWNDNNLLVPPAEIGSATIR